jgi:serine/threonine-protein kinase
LEAGAASVAVTPTDVTATRRPRTRWWLVAGIAAAVPLLGWRAALRMWNDRPSVSSANMDPVRRVTLVLPDSAPLTVIGPDEERSYRALAIAPDASAIAYVAAVGNTTLLYARRLDDTSFHALPETEGAHTPFFSPDGRWIAYLAGTHLFKAPIQGGRPILLAQVVEPHGGAWLPDGHIVVTSGAELALVPEQGGAAVLLPRRGPGSLAAQSEFARFPGRPWITAQLNRQVSFLSLRDTVRRFALVDGGALSQGDNRPAPDRLVYGLGPYVVAGAYLVYAQSGGDGVVMAVPFDTARMRATGAPLPVLEDVRIDDGVPQYDVANDGTLAYVGGRNEMLSYLILRDHAGRIDTIPAPRSDVESLNVSRDGRRVVYARWNPGTDLRYVVTDLASGVTTQLPDSIDHAIWAPDSRSLLASIRVAGGQRRVTLRMSPVTGQVLDTILRDGSVFTVDTAETVFGVKGRRRKPTSIVWKDSTRHPAVEIPVQVGGTTFPGGSTLGSISPSGKWIALTAVSNGTWDVFVAPTEHPDSLVRVTRNGGLEPQWNSDESEIVYRNHRSWYAVSVSTRGALRVGTPRWLFDGTYRDVPGYSYGMTADGHRHLLLGSSEQTARRIELVLGWPTALKRATSRAP